MIEQRLPPGRTINDASKAELLFAVCDTVRGDARRNAPAIAGAAVYARHEYAGDVVETIIRCAFLGKEPDCELVTAVVAAAVATRPGDARAIDQGALSVAPGCSRSVKVTTDLALAAVKERTAPKQSSSPAVIPTPRGSLGGGGAGFNGEQQKISVCEDGTERTILQGRLDDFLRTHPGATIGPCQPTTRSSADEDLVDSRGVASHPSRKGPALASGKEVLLESGKEVLPTSGKEVLPTSGKEVLSESGKESLLEPGKPSSFHVSVSVREGYDDNVYTSSSQKTDSFFTKAGATVDYSFASTETQFDLQAVGGLAYYYDHPFGEEYNVNTALSLSVSHRATSDLTLSGSVYLAYQSEPDFNYILGVNRRAGNFFYTADRFSAGYQWTRRFSTETSYSLGAIHYDDSAIGDFEDRFEHTFGNEFRFLVLPNTTLVGEYRYQIIDFDTSPRDSTGHFVLAGLDHTFNPRFNISLRGGVEFRDIDNFGDRSSPYVEETLSYAVDKQISVSWISRYGLEEPDVALSPSRETFRTGFNIAYNIIPRLASSLAIVYQRDDNDGAVTPALVAPAFIEDSIDICLELRYEISPTFSLLAGYSHTEVFSDVLLREYARNRYYLGLNAVF